MKKTDITEKKKRGLGAQSIYDRLRRDIIELVLQPGVPLDEINLSNQFQMSRTPVREALVRLAADGLVTSLPNRNTIVSVIDFRQIGGYLDALTLMYRVTTRGAAVHHRPHHLEDIRARQDEFAVAVRNQDALAMIATNREFHIAIAEAADNPYYVGLFCKLLDEGQRILRMYYSSFDDRLPDEYVREHEEMITAIQARDAGRADHLASGHAEQISRHIRGLMSRDVAAKMDLN